MTNAIALLLLSVFSVPSHFNDCLARGGVVETLSDGSLVCAVYPSR